MWLIPTNRARSCGGVSLWIAAVKAVLIAAVFMQLREGNALNRLAASAGPIWLFIMFLLIGADYVTR
jgi:cytochrome c oxidase subunit 4